MLLIHTFAHFKGLRLFFLSNFPEATFIQGATSIPDSRVLDCDFEKTNKDDNATSQRISPHCEKVALAPCSNKGTGYKK